MKKALIILTLLVAAVAAWIVAFPQKNPFKSIFKKDPAAPAPANPVIPNPKQPINTGNSPGGAFSPPPPVTDTVPGFPLRQGSTGIYVSKMQEALNRNYGSELAIDGIFGPKTYKSVSANGFNADAVTYDEWKRILGV